jgi:hypothetical protein
LDLNLFCFKDRQTRQPHLNLVAFQKNLGFTDFLVATADAVIKEFFGLEVLDESSWQTFEI